MGEAGGGRAHGRVYPRVCGGTFVVVASVWYWMGLSPRVRGNRRGRHGGAVLMGSIPACAGEPTADTSRFGQFDGSIPACAGEPPAAAR